MKTYFINREPLSIDFDVFANLIKDVQETIGPAKRTLSFVKTIVKDTILASEAYSKLMSDCGYDLGVIVPPTLVMRRLTVEDLRKLYLESKVKSLILEVDVLFENDTRPSYAGDYYIQELVIRYTIAADKFDRLSTSRIDYLVDVVRQIYSAYFSRNESSFLLEGIVEESDNTFFLSKPEKTILTETQYQHGLIAWHELSPFLNYDCILNIGAEHLNINKTRIFNDAIDSTLGLGHIQRNDFSVGLIITNSRFAKAFSIVEEPKFGSQTLRGLKQFKILPFTKYIKSIESMIDATTQDLSISDKNILSKKSYIYKTTIELMNTETVDAYSIMIAAAFDKLKFVADKGYTPVTIDPLVQVKWNKYSDDTSFEATLNGFIKAYELPVIINIHPYDHSWLQIKGLISTDFAINSMTDVLDLLISYESTKTATLTNYPRSTNYYGEGYYPLSWTLNLEKLVSKEIKIKDWSSIVSVDDRLSWLRDEFMINEAQQNFNNFISALNQIPNDQKAINDIIAIDVLNDIIAAGKDIFLGFGSFQTTPGSSREEMQIALYRYYITCYAYAWSVIIGADLVPLIEKLLDSTNFDRLVFNKVLDDERIVLQQR